MNDYNMKTALTIAGSDSSGGAGIQADIKTFQEHGIFGMSVITAITAQNTLGVYDIHDIPLKTIEAQLEAVFSDIFPDAIKIGMTSSIGIIRVISEALKKYNAKNIVIDPVMVSTSGSILLSENAIITLKDELLPLADVITPNIKEAEVIAGIKITDYELMKRAAKEIGDLVGTAVLIKGGHLDLDSNDILYYKGEYHYFRAKKIDNKNTHGTGCTLSSAIAANLAKGYELVQAIALAKDYITKVISNNLNLGKGRGPLNHIIK